MISAPSMIVPTAVQEATLWPWASCCAATCSVPAGGRGRWPPAAARCADPAGHAAPPGLCGRGAFCQVPGRSPVPDGHVTRWGPRPGSRASQAATGSCRRGLLPASEDRRSRTGGPAPASCRRARPRAGHPRRHEAAEQGQPDPGGRGRGSRERAGAPGRGRDGGAPRRRAGRRGRRRRRRRSPHRRGRRGRRRAARPAAGR